MVSGRAGPPVSVWLLVAPWRSWRGEPQVWVTHRCLVRPSMGFGKQPGCALWSKQALPGGLEEAPGGARERTHVFDLLSFDDSSTEFLSLCCVPGILLDALNMVLSLVHGDSLRGYNWYCLHFTDEETEAQTGKISSPSHRARWQPSPPWNPCNLTK